MSARAMSLLHSLLGTQVLGVSVDRGLVSLEVRNEETKLSTVTAMSGDQAIALSTILMNAGEVANEH